MVSASDDVNAATRIKQTLPEFSAVSLQSAGAAPTVWIAADNKLDVSTRRRKNGSKLRFTRKLTFALPEQYYLHLHQQNIDALFVDGRKQLRIQAGRHTTSVPRLLVRLGSVIMLANKYLKSTIVTHLTV